MVFRAAPAPSLLVIAFGTHVFGVDPATGERRWSSDALEGTGHPVRLVVHADRVYAAKSDLLVLLRYQTGELLRRTRLPVKATTFALIEDRLYAAGFGEVACVSLDGDVLWTDTFPGKGLAHVALAIPGYAVQADE